MSNQLHNHARMYAQQGWNIFPCIEKPGDRSKRPYIKNGLHGASADPAQVDQWWDRWPRALIGLALPPGVVVIDIDPRHGGTIEALRQIAGTLPDTLTSVSGRGDGGQHLWFSTWRRDLVQREVAAGIDSRIGGKGYVIVPPSPHPDTGMPYGWESRAEIAPLTHPLTALLKPAPAPRRTTLPGGLADHQGSVSGLVKTVLDAREGERNSKLYWAACRMAEREHAGQAAPWEELAGAALACGLTERETIASINSARFTIGRGEAAANGASAVTTG